MLGKLRQLAAVFCGLLLLSAASSAADFTVTSGAGKTRLSTASTSQAFGARAITDGAGRTIVAGYSGSVEQGTLAPVVLRLTSGGTVDRSYGTSGFVQPAPRPALLEGGAAMTRDSRQRTLVGHVGATHISVYRLLESGALDTSFGNFAGLAVVYVGPATVPLSGIAVDAEDRVLVAVTTVDGAGKSLMSVVRLGERGTVDESFGLRGIARIPTEQLGIAADLKVQRDGRILVAGHHGDRGWWSLALARLHSDGVLDATFGQNGVATFESPGRYDLASRLLLQGDGKAVLGGTRCKSWQTYCSLVVLRADGIGQLDRTFGTEGVALIDTGMESDALMFDLIATPDGFAAAGSLFFGPSRVDYVIGKVLADGRVDAAFGERGVRRGTFGAARSIAMGISYDANNPGFVLTGADADAAGLAGSWVIQRLPLQ